MPIPFRDVADVDDLGYAAFLRIERTARGSTYLGALFVVNARGEPIELVYNALETPYPFLWRPSDLRRHAERRLTASLLGAAEERPRLLFCLASEAGAELFVQDVLVDVPTARIEAPGATRGREPAEADLDAPQVFWHPAPPAPESGERELFDRLVANGLLLEPFDRASDGLREVYGPRAKDAEDLT